LGSNRIYWSWAIVGFKLKFPLGGFVGFELVVRYIRAERNLGLLLIDFGPILILEGFVLFVFEFAPGDIVVNILTKQKFLVVDLVLETLPGDDRYSASAGSVWKIRNLKTNASHLHSAYNISRCFIKAVSANEIWKNLNA
jgi:hypothetical protein